MDDVSLCAALGRNTTVFSDGIQVTFPLMLPRPPRRQERSVAASGGGRRLEKFPEMQKSVNPSFLTSLECLGSSSEAGK